MPIIKTTGWLIEKKAESRFIHLNETTKLPVFVRNFANPHSGYSMVYPQGKLDSTLWTKWLTTCQKNALFDVQNKIWVWTRLTLERMSTLNEASSVATPFALTKEEREKLKEDRKLAEQKFISDLNELSKNENIPEELWPTYQYPSHYVPNSAAPAPTALQRIVVSKYWNQTFALVAASVGTGKSRMTVDILSARALSDSLSRRNSARIVLVVAPLALHENWRREFVKWAPPEVEWHCHKFSPTKGFWKDAERSATHLFDGPSLKTGGLVIICTPNALSRSTLYKQFSEMGYVPTAIIVDEVQRCFRNPTNSAYLTLMKFRANAHMFLGLSGTPTSKFEDWWSLNNLMANGDLTVQWKGGTYTDYQKLGDRLTMADSGLFERGWDFNRAIKEFHADRIKKGHIFVADKFYYMKDALPGLDQEEVGEFADTRLSFNQLFEQHPAWVDAALELQNRESPAKRMGNSTYAVAQTLLLRMRQLAALSQDTKALLGEFVRDFLNDVESCVFWVEFRNAPCEELQQTVDFLNQFGPTCYIMGGMSPEMRQEAIDGFQAGRYRFIVCQIDAGGVGLTLTRASKCLFLTIPFGYLAVSQAIGRLHRIGQMSDVTSYFAMTSPVAAFARKIYDSRAELNEHIPQQISGVLKQIVDTPAEVT